MRALLKWIDDRCGIARLGREILFESIPGGARWRYVWGSTVLFAIFVLFITGVVLWMFYSPGATTAWESVSHLQKEVAGGAWLRGIHHWTAQILLVLLVLHLVQLVIDGAYRAPRELNFWCGLALLGVTVALALTGRLLPWDEEGLRATELAIGIVAGTPVIGDHLKLLAVGGAGFGHLTLTRFFALHAGILPALLAGLIVLHVQLFRRHGIAPAAPKTPASRRRFWWMVLVVMIFGQAMLMWNWEFVPLVLRIVLLSAFVLSIFRLVHLQSHRERFGEEAPAEPGRGDAHFWPDQVLRDAIACAAVLGAVLFLAWQFGPGPGAPADPSADSAAARPEWYLMALFQLLELPGIDLVTGAFIIPGAIALGVILMPFLGRWRVGHALNLVVLFLLLVAFVFGTLAGYRHYWKDEDHELAVRAVHRDAERVEVLARAPSGIPPAGALTLLRNDPCTQGPKLFAAHCASCHPWDGHDGTGRPRTDPPSAPDLHGFGDRNWAAAMLNPATFGDIHYFGGTKLIADSEMLKYLRKKLTGLDAGGREEVRKMALALSAEAGLESQAAMDADDAEAIEEGKRLMGETGYACTECHRYHEEGDGGPDLTGYGSREWQIEFIRNPEHERFYGERNDRMPVYGPKLDRRGREERPELMSEKEIGFIVDWIRGDYYEEAPESPPPAGNAEPRVESQVPGENPDR